MNLRRQTKQEIETAIAAGAEPRVPRSGIGLVLPYQRQRKVLVNQGGQLTAAGKHYYMRVRTESHPRASTSLRSRSAQGAAS